MRKLLIIIISLALIFFFLSRIREDLQRYRLLTDEVKSLEQTKSNILKEKERTQQLLEKEKQEETLEQAARLMLGLKKSGEEVIMVLPTNDSSNVVELQNSTSSDSLFEKPFNSFFSKISQIWYNLIEKLKK
jgi:cell division protein FtsB